MQDGFGAVLGRGMLLQGEVALRERILQIRVIDGRDAVHLDDDVIALSDDLLREPGVGRDEHLADEDEVVEAAGLLLIGEVAVDLGLVALGKPGPERGAEILAAVALVADLGLDAEVEVGEVAALAEEMAGLFAAGDDDALLDAPLAGVLWVRLPAGEVFAVEKGNPAVGLLLLAAGVERRRHRNCR